MNCAAVLLAALESSGVHLETPDLALEGGILQAPLPLRLSVDWFESGSEDAKIKILADAMMARGRNVQMQRLANPAVNSQIHEAETHISGAACCRVIKFEAKNGVVLTRVDVLFKASE